MGVTKAEGRRIFFYEAGVVVGGAMMLGTLSGFCTAILITSQFYMFIEMPFVVEFPWLLLLTMLVISTITTIVAVCVPINQVNKKQIATVLKAGS